MLSDSIISGIDNALRTLTGNSRGSGRPNPSTGQKDSLLRPLDRQQAGRMMRVNHAGEVMAQALYTGQAAGTDDPALRETLLTARREEEDHLRWCEDRLRELGSHPSLLGPIWYATAWAMGYAAAQHGRGSNLGLVVAVENLVEEHLKEHLDGLPAEDRRSRSILEQMQADETCHARNAEHLGAASMPVPVRIALRGFSRVMTRGALWI